MDALDFTLAGFAILFGAIYLAGIVFAVLEYRRWNLPLWTIPLAVIMFIPAMFIFPVVEHIARPRMRAAGADRRIIRLKLWLAWCVAIFASAGISLCEFFCNRVADPEFSDLLATCCALSCLVLYVALLFGANAALNRLAANPVRPL